MIKIKDLTIANVGRFVGTHTFNFDLLTSLSQVDAKNLNTGGSSGSGKSTIFNSLDYLFGVSDLSATVLQSRLTKDSMSVSANIEIDNVPYLITRSKSGGLSISGPKGLVHGSAKISEEYLDKLIGIDRSLIRQMYHKKQNEGGFFLSMTPKEVFAFMSQCLGIDSLTQKQNKLEEIVKHIEPKISVIKDQIVLNKSSAEQAEQMLVSLVPPIKTVEESVLLQLGEKEKTQSNVVQSLRLLLEEKLCSIPKPTQRKVSIPADLASLKQQIVSMTASKQSQIAQHRAVIKSAQSKLSVLNKGLWDLESSEQMIPSLEEKIAKAKEQILSMKDSKCPVCAQSWEQGQISPHFTKLLEETRQTSDLLKQIKLGSEQKDKLVSEIQNTSKSIEDAEKALLREESSIEIDGLNSKKQQIEDQYNADSQQAIYEYEGQLLEFEKKRNDIRKDFETQILKESEQLDMLRQARIKGEADLSAFNSALLNFNNTKLQLQQNLETYASKLKNAQAQLEGLESELLLATESHRFLKSFTTNLFYDSLAQVAERASYILSRIPNIGTATIAFDTAKETKSGSIKEEVTAMFSIDGELQVPIKSLSGGEKASVDLAVDLAVLEMIEAKTGKGFDFLILDEPFNGLDSVSKEACLEMLQMSGSSKKIIIVDHSNETKEMVQYKTTIVREGLESRIEQI